MKKRQLFCSRPFEWLEVQGRQAAFCCQGWTNINYIDMEGLSTEEIWNHKTAKQFRASILDGSFRHCRNDECVFLGQKDLPHWQPGGSPVQYADEVTNPRLRKIIDEEQVHLEDGPKILNCGYDDTCNISCPSCRTEVRGLKGEKLEQEKLFQDQLFGEIGKDLDMLYITGSGDPYASVVYRTLLRSLTQEEYPNLEIHLHSNGQLWTPKNWEAMSGINKQITSAHISMDAASPATYTINRRGSRWDRQMQNLEYISQLRKDGPLEFVMMSFVVQANNFREMPDFIALGEKFGFDLCLFTEIHDWGVLTKSQFARSSIANPLHPEYQDFLDVLEHECFDNPIAGLGCLTKLRKKALRRPRENKHKRGFGISSLLPVRVVADFQKRAWLKLQREWHLRFKKVTQKQN